MSNDFPLAKPFLCEYMQQFTVTVFVIACQTLQHAVKYKA